MIVGEKVKLMLQFKRTIFWGTHLFSGVLFRDKPKLGFLPVLCFRVDLIWKIVRRDYNFLCNPDVNQETGFTAVSHKHFLTVE